MTWFLNLLNWLKFLKFTIAHLKVSRSKEVPRHSVLGLQVYFFLILLACATLQNSWTGKNMCAGVPGIILKEDIKKQTKKMELLFSCLCPEATKKTCQKTSPRVIGQTEVTWSFLNQSWCGKRLPCIFS